MITTKRHLFKFYFSIAFVTFVFLALGFLSLFSFHGFYMNGTLEFKNYFLPILGVGCLIMPIYSIYQYFKNAPTISIDLEKITFQFLVNDMSYRLSDIEVIQLTGKLPFRYIVRFPMEGTLLMFKDGRNVMIFDDMYSNSWQLKTFLEEVVIHKNAFRIHDDITINESNIDWNNLYLFKGNQFTSMEE